MTGWYRHCRAFLAEVYEPVGGKAETPIDTSAKQIARLTVLLLVASLWGFVTVVIPRHFQWPLFAITFILLVLRSCTQSDGYGHILTGTTFTMGLIFVGVGAVKMPQYAATFLWWAIALFTGAITWAMVTFYCFPARRRALWRWLR